MYERILVPTDGSDASFAAADHAIDLASHHDSALHTLYVIDTRVDIEDTAGTLHDALEEIGERSLEELRNRARDADVSPIEGSLASGPPHRGILNYIEANDIDLVVMGTHGRTGLRRYLLGSVTEKVVRLSDVPVLTVRPPAAEPEEEA